MGLTETELLVALDALQDDAAAETTVWAWAVLELFAETTQPKLSCARAGTHKVTEYRWGAFPPRIQPHLSQSASASLDRPDSVHGTRVRSASGYDTGGLAYSLTRGARMSLTSRGCLL